MRTSTRSASRIASSTSCVTRRTAGSCRWQSCWTSACIRIRVERVERAERLVEEEQARVSDERPRQRDPLGFTARQRLRPVPLVAGQTDLAQGVPTVGRGVRTVEPEDDVLEHPRPRQEARRPGRRRRGAAGRTRRRSHPGRARPAPGGSCSCPSRSGRAARRTRHAGSPGRRRGAPPGRPNVRRSPCATTADVRRDHRGLDHHRPGTHGSRTRSSVRTSTSVSSPSTA